MTAFVIAILFTLAVSAFCSLLEAMILSTSTAEIESLKKTHPRRGVLLEKFKNDIEETSSAILSLNTVANTLGAVICGVLASDIFGKTSQLSLVYFPLGMTFGILVFSEIIPKNVGVLYRSSLQPYMVFPLQAVRWAMLPFSYLGMRTVRFLLRRQVTTGNSDEEIILLADKGAKDGSLTQAESNLVANALRLDDVDIGDIMTPRTVVTALEKTSTVGEVFAEFPNIPFARMPVYDDTIDDIVGVVRRRDLLKAKANAHDETTVGALMQQVVFVPENATAAYALQLFLKHHQQLGVVVDEFGSMSGVVTMEDIFEQLLGAEIFEKDDVAIDMRELARRRMKRRANATTSHNPAKKT